MNVMANGRPEEIQISLLNGDVREFGHKEAAPARIVQSDDAEADKANFLVDRVGRNSVKELDRLIADLQRVRDYLVTEGERVQRSISKYFEASQSTMVSVKVISDSMSQWQGIDPIRGDKG
jgi:hypothetical protein